MSVHSPSDDFISEYMQYAGGTEVPDWYNRWSIITSIGAFLGRQYYFQHGHFTIYPNIYAMLIGSSGTKKSTAIKLAKKLLVQVGYKSIAAEKTTKEKFMMDLAGVGIEESNGHDVIDKILDQNLWGTKDEDAETFIMADEFNEFFGNGNFEFISLLGTLWDYSGEFRSRTKNGKSIVINNPTISILGGNTPAAFSMAFPAETIGQGFFSRILLIYGEPSGKRIPFPSDPGIEFTNGINNAFAKIKSTVSGQVELSDVAERLLSKIYHNHDRIDDPRFEPYSNRRFPHLLKLCLITSASRLSRRIDERDVIYANTILTHAEQLMPKALGEFGKAKNSDVGHKVISVIEAAITPLKFKQIWKAVSTDFDDMKQLTVLLTGMLEAGKIQVIPNMGYLPKRKVIEERIDDMVDYGLLTEQEKRISR